MTENKDISSAFNSYENNYLNEILEKDFEDENHVKVNVIDIVLFNTQVATDIDRNYCV